MIKIRKLCRVLKKELKKTWAQRKGTILYVNIYSVETNYFGENELYRYKDSYMVVKGGCGVEHEDEEEKQFDEYFPFELTIFPKDSYSYIAGKFYQKIFEDL